MTRVKSKGSTQLSDIKVLDKEKDKETKKSRNERDFANILQKCTGKGWSNVIDFLRDKTTNSVKTAVGYWTGIKHLNDFVVKQYSDEYDVQTIIEPLKQERIDIYNLLRLFKLYLLQDAPKHDMMATGSVINYIKYAKSYFLFSDIDIIDHKFRARVKMPQLHKEDEQAIDAQDIIEILHHTDNRRLKAYILLLASSGCRAVEGLAIREMDIDWSGIDFNSHDPTDMLEPAGVKIRKEYTKTRRGRNIFISNECARYLNELLDWKYRFQKPTPTKARSDASAEGELIFSRVGRGREADPARLYTSMALEFGKVLDKIKSKKYGTRKNDGNNVTPRRIITLHSFRRFVKTVIENNSSSNYSEWFLGHAKSSYWVSKPEELRRTYKEDCMKYLTFLDYSSLESTSKNIEARLKDEIKNLKEQIIQRDAKTQQLQVAKQSEANETTKAIADLMNTVKQLEKKVNDMENK